MADHNKRHIEKQKKKAGVERKAYSLTVLWALLCLFIFDSLFTQKQYGDQIYSAYVTGDIRLWEGVISSLENSGTPTLESKLELAEYYYAHIGYLLGIDQKSAAKTYLNRSETLIDSILKEAPGNPTATSLKGICIAYRMEMNKIKAPVLGPQCMKLIKRAHQTDPGNVQAISDMGNMYYHCPPVFGGDKALGLQYLHQAADLLEQRGEESGNWFYLNLLTITAQYEAESGSKSKAKEIYEKILRIEPDFIWVRDELYPGLVHDI